MQHFSKITQSFCLGRTFLLQEGQDDANGFLGGRGVETGSLGDAREQLVHETLLPLVGLMSRAAVRKSTLLSIVVRLVPADGDADPALLPKLLPVMTHAAALHDRHSRLQRLAIVDDLTSLYNGRYFRHYLSIKILWSVWFEEPLIP